jgi:hypothetical protein
MTLISRLLDDCAVRRHLIASYRAEDRMVDGAIISGRVSETWSVCGRRKGHKGDHGPGSFVRRLARMFAT